MGPCASGVQAGHQKSRMTSKHILIGGFNLFILVILIDITWFFGFQFIYFGDINWYYLIFLGFNLFILVILIDITWFFGFQLIYFGDINWYYLIFFGFN